MKRIIATLLLLSACAPAVVTRGGAETFTVRYEHEGVYSPAIGTQKLNAAAEETCKSGKWKILEESRDAKAASFGATEWKIKCL